MFGIDKCTYVHYRLSVRNFDPQKGYLMSRKKIERLVKEPPLYTSFKPTGVPKGDMVRIILTLDEYEAIKLADYKGFDHADAALEMEISRSTFSRLVMKAREKVAKFIIDGCELNIDGGDIHFINNIYRCAKCRHRFNRSIMDEFVVCPICGSGDLFDLAGGFGHGSCCRGHEHGKGIGKRRRKR